MIEPEFVWDSYWSDDDSALHWARYPIIKKTPKRVYVSRWSWPGPPPTDEHFIFDLEQYEKARTESVPWVGNGRLSFRVLPPGCFRQLGLSWPCSADDVRAAFFKLGEPARAAAAEALTAFRQELEERA